MYPHGEGKVAIKKAGEELTADGDIGGEGFAGRVYERLGSPSSPTFETVRKYVRDLGLDPDGREWSG